jgi:general secretion pathway protein C
MEAIFKQYFWVIKVLGVAIAAGLGASAVVTQVGTRVALDVRPADAKDKDGDEGDDDTKNDGTVKFKKKNPFRRSSSTSTLAASKRTTGNDIQKRNIFCPTCLPESEEAVTSGVPLDADGRPVGIQPGEVKTTLPLRLMATMEADDPQYSLATVYDGDEGVSGLYGVGDAIRPSVSVVGIDAGIIHIRNSARLEYVQLGDEAPIKKTTRPTPTRDDKKKDDKKKNSREIEGADDAINCPDENTCVVERAFVEKLMANPTMLAKQARIVPSQRDGEVQGFKFYGIRRGSLPKLLGLKNGDMLTEVNGEEIKSVDQAMSLAMKLRRASNLSVKLVRRGQTINKEIQIQ